MYESYFGLCRRPFSATPDPNCFVAVESVRQILDELAACVAGGQGIAILTAPPGTGKTLLCERLAIELGDAFETVLLNNANFPTKRSLLQSILYELGQPYNRMDEQELRLELATAVKSVRAHKRGVVLIFDEAHLLNVPILEEIRSITNLIEDGEPLVRIVLSGHLPLEETLADPALVALNQRVRCHVSLPALTRQESAQYVAQRLDWAGGNSDAVFTSEALELIAHASDGLPRCLNQLCDHSLLLAYVSDRKPVTADIVREALSDLKTLPLHWNEPLPAAPADFDPADAADEPLEDGRPLGDREERPAAEIGQAVDADVEETPDAFEFGADESVAVIEFGAPEDAPSEPADATADGESQPDEAMPRSHEVEAGGSRDGDPTDVVASASSPSPPCDHDGGVPDDADAFLSFESSPPTFNQDIPMTTTFNAGQFEEEVVVDRYAALDARLEQAHGPGIVWNIVAHERDDERESTHAEAESTFNTSPVPESIEPQDPQDSQEPSQADHDEAAAEDFADDYGAHPGADALERYATSDPSGESVIDEPLDAGAETIAVGTLGETDPEARIDAIDTLLEDALGSPSGTPPVESQLPNAAPPHEDSSSVSLQLIAPSLDDESLENVIGRDVLDVSLDLEQARLDRLYQVETVNVDAILQAVQPLAEVQDHVSPESLGEAYDVVEPIDEENDPRARGDADRPESVGRLSGRRPGLRLEPARRPDPPHRPYAHLFSKLRRRQEGSESTY